MVTQNKLSGCDFFNQQVRKWSHSRLGDSTPVVVMAVLTLSASLMPPDIYSKLGGFSCQKEVGNSPSRAAGKHRGVAMHTMCSLARTGYQARFPYHHAFLVPSHQDLHAAVHTMTRPRRQMNGLWLSETNQTSPP